MVTPASPPDLDAIEAAERGAGAPDRTVLALVAYAREISTRFGRYREEAEVDRVVSRAQARNLESAIDVAVLAERERCLSIVRSQPYYPDTNVGKRQQWVKDEIERRILASAPPHGLDGMRAASWLPSIDDGMPADDPELTALSPEELRATVAWWRERCREWSAWAGILCARIGAIPDGVILGAVRSREAIERAIEGELTGLSISDAIESIERAFDRALRDIGVPTVVPEVGVIAKAPAPRVESATREALDAMVRHALVTHPLPWKVEKDWTWEIIDANGACVCKCMTPATAQAIVAAAEESERRRAAAVPEVERLLSPTCPRCGERDPKRLILDEDAHEIGCVCGNVFSWGAGAS